MCFFKKAKIITFKGDSTKDLVWMYDASNEKKVVLFAEAQNEIVHIKNGAIAGIYANQKIEHALRDDNLNKYYFINVKMPCEILWGTKEKVEYKDTSTGRIVSIGAGGTARLHISDSKKFIEKVLGTRAHYTTDDFTKEMRAKIMDEFGAHLISILDTEKITYAQMDGKRKEIGQNLLTRLNLEFDKYGVHIEEFIIEDFMKAGEIKERANKQADKAEDFNEVMLDADRELAYLKKQEELEKQKMQMSKTRAEHNVGIGKIGAQFASEVEKMSYENKGASYKELREMNRDDIWTAAEAEAKVQSAIKNPEITVVNKVGNQNKCQHCGADVTTAQIFCPICGKKVF